MADEIIEEKQGAGETVGEPVELTDEELDRIADTAIAALQDILKYFNVGEVRETKASLFSISRVTILRCSSAAMARRSMLCNSWYPPSRSAR